MSFLSKGIVFADSLSQIPQPLLMEQAVSDKPPGLDQEK